MRRENMSYNKGTRAKKTIGILGGMGPLASANLYLKMVKASQEMYHAEQDTDFPPIFIYSLPLFGFDQTGFVDQALVRNQLLSGVKKLEEAGSDFIVIACNTVHYFYEDMQNAVKIPIVSIIEETSRVAQEEGYKTIGLLSSESTNALGIYQKDLARRGVKVLSVDKRQQELLNKVIFSVMSGIQGVEEKEILKEVMDDLCGQGAQAIILGCTEIPLAIQQSDVDVKVFDSTEIITQCALERAME